jgi:hypothetical protein
METLILIPIAAISAARYRKTSEEQSMRLQRQFKLLFNALLQGRNDRNHQESQTHKARR